MEEQTMNINEAMKALCVSRPTIERWIKRGKFTGAKKTHEAHPPEWAIPTIAVLTIYKSLRAKLTEQIRKLDEGMEQYL